MTCLERCARWGLSPSKGRKAWSQGTRGSDLLTGQGQGSYYRRTAGPFSSIGSQEMATWQM
jgi:hypothetical protein